MSINTCPHCGFPGYQGLFRFECSNEDCPNFDEKMRPTVPEASSDESDTKPMFTQQVLQKFLDDMGIDHD